MTCARLIPKQKLISEKQWWSAVFSSRDTPLIPILMIMKKFGSTADVIMTSTTSKGYQFDNQVSKSYRTPKGTVQHLGFCRVQRSAKTSTNCSRMMPVCSRCVRKVNTIECGDAYCRPQSLENAIRKAYFVCSHLGYLLKIRKLSCLREAWYNCLPSDDVVDTRICELCDAPMCIFPHCGPPKYSIRTKSGRRVIACPGCIAFKINPARLEADQNCHFFYN